MASAPTHAGGVVFRREDASVRYLLVTAKHTDEWVLPKGHVESGESPEHAALREVREETGVVAQLRGRIPKKVIFVANGQRVIVVFFLMEFLREDSGLENRKKRWLPIDLALRSATHEETRSVLKLADDMTAQLGLQ
jgi:8-oxo-dGTP pyrophosphatase MutT (NUDIX family)